MTFDTHLRDRWKATAHARMAEAGLRSGAARLRVVDVLAEDAQCLIGPRDVLDGLRRRGHVGSQASVYRALDELTGLGLLVRTVNDDGLARYEIADAHHHHHHFVEDGTGRVEAFEDPQLEQALLEAARRLGVTLTGHDIVLRGRREDPAD